ncbi:DMT family transporter [Micromonospora inyonensis]|uniref:EamA-like transporter family protein n=1 Tax=Micromonospora inyonensis TaxID=47866 RepID=A0A1C6RA80_9ACTN|nr:DMT family transporter [Micromonospora inyonensis]SCL14033.1 EamA-like transporter family protein [Micromonospora inyonensis]
MVIFSPWESANEIASWGGLACLAAAASYGVSYVYLGRYLTGRGISPIVLSASQLGAATALLALAMPFAGLEPPVWRVDAVFSLLVLGVLGTGVAYVLNYRIISDEGPTAASVVAYLLPIVAVLLGWLVVDEPVTGAILVGVGLVLVGGRTHPPAGRPVAARRPPRLAGRRHDCRVSSTASGEAESADGTGGSVRHEPGRCGRVQRRCRWPRMPDAARSASG